jgi:hypothetical protein
VEKAYLEILERHIKLVEIFEDIGYGMGSIPLPRHLSMTKTHFCDILNRKSSL